YAANQLNLWPCMSLPETSPTLRWTGEVGDASEFRDVTFDESVPFYRLFPYRTAPLLSPPLFLAPGPPPVDSLPPQGPAPSGVSQVDPLPSADLVEVAVDSGAAGGGAARDAACGGAEPEHVEHGGAEPRVAESEGAEPRGAESERVEPGGAESGGAELGGTVSAGGPTVPSSRQEPLSLLHLREWFARRTRLRSGATGAGGPAAGDNGAGGTGAVGDGGTAATGGAGAAGPGGPRAGGAGAAGPGGAHTGGIGAAGAGGVAAAGGAGDARACSPRGTRASGAGVGAATRGAGGDCTGGTGAGDPGAEVAGAGRAGAVGTDSLTERHAPASCLASRARAVCIGRCVPRPRPPPVPGTHDMALFPSCVPLRIPLPSPPASSNLDVMEPEFDLVHAASPTVTHLLAAVVTDPLFESTTASALVVELVDFAATCRLDYAASLVADSESVCPSSIGRRPGCTKHPTVRSYAEAITASYSSQRQTAMDAEMASWKSTGTSVDTVLPPRANIVDGMWIFRVKRPPGSPPVFKARYIARGFSQRHGVDFFQTFSPTPKMTTLWVLLHVAAQRDYELHSLESSTAFLQHTLHKEIWLRRPRGFTGSFPEALGFAPSNADPSLFLRTDTSLPPFYILVYVDDLVFATADTEAQTLLKSELQKRHTCTDLDELRSYLGLHITRDRARRTITLTQLHMVLQRFDFRFSSPQSTPLPTGHSLSAPPLDESVELTGLYPEQVGCLMHLMTCIRPDLAYPLSILARYIAPGRHRPEHWEAAKRVLRYLCSTSSMGLVLGGRARVVLSGHADASWVEDLATQRSSQGYTFSLGSGSVSWRSTRSSSVLSSSCEAEIYVGAMAVQELRWLTYLLTDLGEPPRSPPILYEDNKAMLALCQEHRQEHMTKHIALRYFLARELQQRGQLGLAYVATRANTADIFTKALQS
ncbi:unnamed protein product, partial [Closterium sp. NIES-53]